MRLLAPAMFSLAAMLLLQPLQPTSSLRAQTQPAVASDTSGALPLVFLDCQADGCDMDFLRMELAWMNFVRDRLRAEVHVIATSRGTASGGSELSVTFERRNVPNAPIDTVLAFVPQSATDDQSRRILARAIGQGMLPIVKNSPLGAQLSITYKALTTKKSDTRGAKDPWHLWVYRVGGSGWGNGDENYKSISTSASVRASRTTNLWKIHFSVNGNYRENSYVLSDTQNLKTYQHSWNGNAGAVRSLTSRWSLGATTQLSSSVQSNQDLFMRAGPALEFNLFPYTESTRRQLIFRYTAGVRYADYTAHTIYDKLSETHPDHQMLIGTDIRQSWGNISASATFNQLLSDPSKNNLDLNGYISWRITTGLNFDVGGGYGRIRNQLNLKRGEQAQQEVLLQLRQLQTGYSYYGNIGLSFTFGSIFQNVVNPRLSMNNFF
ncbi:MAG: hypothetical protein ACO1Q7_20590 [Gemmatimonas sp.]